MAKPLKKKDRLLLFIAPPLASLIIRLLHMTLRIETLFEERVRPFWENDERMILAFWHGRLLMIPFCYKGKGIKLLISQHKDGELLARTMRWFGYDTVRGSSTRGGMAAMKAMIRSIRESDIAITPDGPKGPKYIVQEGTVALARLSGVPVVPVTFAASKKKIFGSWDAFNLPFPFSRGLFVWGEPFYVAKDADMEEARLELERQMQELTELADKQVQKES
jgi:lysophospholipid acyltransferase (LPLAT)-like uncharacterized protein